MFSIKFCVSHDFRFFPVGNFNYPVAKVGRAKKLKVKLNQTFHPLNNLKLTKFIFEPFQSS